MITIPNLDIKDITQGESENWNTQGYYITEVRVHNLLRYFPIRQRCFQLGLCIKGNIKVRINGEIFFYDVGTIAIYTPATIIETLEVSDDFECHLVVFRENFITETLNNIYFLREFRIINSGRAYLKLNHKQSVRITAQFEKIKEIFREPGHKFKRDIIRSLIIILMYETENMLTKQVSEDTKIQNPGTGGKKILFAFQNLLFKNFRKERKVAYYADKLNISSPQLTRIVKEYTGRTPKEHIEEAVLSQAKVWLKSGEYNVSEVSSLLNYNSIEEFSRFFKKKLGVGALTFSKIQ